MEKIGWTYQVETRAREGLLRQECDESCPRKIVNRYRPADQAPYANLSWYQDMKGPGCQDILSSVKHIKLLNREETDQHSVIDSPVSSARLQEEKRDGVGGGQPMD